MTHPHLWQAIPHELRNRAIWCANSGALQRMLALRDRSSERARLDEILAAGGTDVAFELTPALGLVVITFAGGASHLAQLAAHVDRLSTYGEVASNGEDIQFIARYGDDFRIRSRANAVLDGEAVRLSVGTELVECTGRHLAATPRSIGSLHSRLSAELQGISVWTHGGLVTRHVVAGADPVSSTSFRELGRAFDGLRAR
jgi:hypothetical protein